MRSSALLSASRKVKNARKVKNEKTKTHSRKLNFVSLFTFRYFLIISFVAIMILGNKIAHNSKIPRHIKSSSTIMEEEKFVIKSENIKRETVDEISVSHYQIRENQLYDSNDFVCNTCKRSFIVSSHLREHKLEIECPFCLEGSSSAIKEHEKYYEARKKKLQCNKAREKKSKYKCYICSMTYDKKYKLKRHLDTHEKPFECDLCSYRAARKTNLPPHMEIHRASSSRNRSSNQTTLKDKIVFQCKICQKSFESKYKIIGHILFNHSGKRL